MKRMILLLLTLVAAFVIGSWVLQIAGLVIGMLLPFLLGFLAGCAYTHQHRRAHEHGPAPRSGA